MIGTDNPITGTAMTNASEVFQAVNPTTRELIPESFRVANLIEVNKTVESAHEAWQACRKSSGAERAALLRQIAIEIEGLSESLIDRAMAESGLPQARLEGERARTCNQLRSFAQLTEEGHWVEASIDLADAGHQPNVDLRKMLHSRGVAVVFPASNFPLAFSTAGGDTASALAAGCPVIIKAHPSHPGTNDLVAQAIQKAVHKCGLPEGVFSSLHGAKTVGEALVQHPLVQAVGFTGSLAVGKHLMDLASQRPCPIPVYAEMGSNNPIFILPEKISSDTSALAITIAGSVNLGAGQFCTNPGLIVVEESPESEEFLAHLATAFNQLEPSTMLNEGIHRSYEKHRDACTKADGVSSIHDRSSKTTDWLGQPAFATVNAADFLAQPELQTEVFGPFTLVIKCKDKVETLAVADSLNGQLTATIYGTDQELTDAIDLLDILTIKAGRVLFNGVPTGVAVSPAMHHGGPFPAGSNAAYTSVGMDAIKRFARPVCYQNAPQTLLPVELQDGNPLGICRKVNGQMQCP